MWPQEPLEGATNHRLDEGVQIGDPNSETAPRYRRNAAYRADRPPHYIMLDAPLTVAEAHQAWDGHGVSVRRVRKLNAIQDAAHLKRCVPTTDDIKAAIRAHFSETAERRALLGKDCGGS